MLNAPTVEKLHALKLDAMAAAWTEQQHQADMTALAVDERFGLLVEAEWLARENKRLARALQEVKLKLSQACLEAIDYPARREQRPGALSTGERYEKKSETPELRRSDRGHTSWSGLWPGL